MNDLTWHYTENQFDNSTKGSKRRMKLMGQRHQAALDNAPVGIKAALLARVTPPYEAFAEKYDEWVNQRGTLSGAVVAYQGLLGQLSAEGIENLETAFKVVHRRGSPQHATAFVGGRAPYQEGADDERVEALKNLKTRMVNLATPALAAVIAQATALLTPLLAARTAVADATSAAEYARTQMEPLRVALAVALYRNMAGLMQELGPSENVAAFFDLELLRQSGGEGEDGGSTPPPPPPVLPTAPQNVTVQAGSSGSGAVQAGCDPVSGATAYNFYSDGILKATSAEPSATLEGFTPGDSVPVIIKAENAAGEGPGSEPVTGTAG